jgi:hypothetical protein
LYQQPLQNLNLQNRREKRSGGEISGDEEGNEIEQEGLEE